MIRALHYAAVKKISCIILCVKEPFQSIEAHLLVSKQLVSVNRKKDASAKHEAKESEVTENSSVKHNAQGYQLQSVCVGVSVSPVFSVR